MSNAEEKKVKGDQLQKRDGEDAAYIRRRKMVSVVSLIILVGVMVAIYFVVGRPLIRSISDPESFREYVNHSNWFLGRLFMIGIMVLQVVIGIIPGEPMEIGAGYAFGAIEGMILCLIGAFIGQLLIFIFVRKLGIKLVEAFISREKLESVKFFRNSKKLELTAFIIYLIPGTPKDLITYAAGLTPINMWHFLGLTTIARIPSVITSTIVGGSLGEGQIVTAAIVLGITAIISLGGILLYRKYSKKNEEEPQKTE